MKLCVTFGLGLAVVASLARCHVVASSEETVSGGIDETTTTTTTQPLDLNLSSGVAVDTTGARFPGLRGGSEIGDDVETHIQDLEAIEASLTKEMEALKNPVEVVDMSVEERASFMEQVKDTLANVATNYLKAVDWTGSSRSADGTQDESLVQTLERTIPHIDNAVELVRQASGGRDGFKKRSEQTSSSQRNRRTEEKKRKGKNKSYKPPDSFDFSNFANMKSYQDVLRATSKMSNHPGHQQMQKQQHKRKSGGASLMGKHVSSHGGRRRLDETYENKYYMCEQLAQCVKSMSIYDMFVFFKSDDIDQASGSVDENMVVYDEKDYLIKYETTQSVANEILDTMSRRRLDAVTAISDELSAQCNGLLREFHRSVESDEVPKWEGGTVAQVCYAEGTQVYVKVGDAAYASVDTSGFRKVAAGAVQAQFANGGAGDVWVNEVSQNDNILKISAASDGKKFALDSSGKLRYNHEHHSSTSWRTSSRDFSIPMKSIDAASGNKIAVIDFNNEAFVHDTDYDEARFDRIGTDIDWVSVGRDGFVMGIKHNSNGANQLCVRKGGSWDCSNLHSRVCGLDFDKVFVGSRDHIYFVHENDDIYHFNGWDSYENAEAKCTPSSSSRTYKKIKGEAKWLSVAVDSDGNLKSLYHIGTNNDVYVYRKHKDIYNDSDVWKKIAEGTYTSVSSNGRGSLYATTGNGNWCKWDTSSFNFDNWSGYTDDIDLDGWNEFECSDSSWDWQGIKVSAVTNDVCMWAERDNADDSIKCRSGGSGSWNTYSDLTGHSTNLKHFDIGASRFNMYTVGKNAGYINRRRPDNWRPISGSSVKAVRDISISNDGKVFMLDFSGDLWSRGYSSGSPTEFPARGHWRKIAAVDANHVWVISRANLVYLVTVESDDSLSWIGYSKPDDGKDIRDIAAGPDLENGSPWVLDEENNVHRLNRHTSNWIEESTDDFTFGQVSVGKEDFVVGLATNGVTRLYSGSDVRFRGLAEAYEKAVQTYAQETLRCASKLFFKDNIRSNTRVFNRRRFRNEQFVFGINGTDPRRPCNDDSCDMSRYRVPVEVCHPDDAGCHRDEFGQLIDNKEPAYTFKEYNIIVQEYRACAYGLVDEFDADLTEKLVGDNVKNAEDGLQVLEETMADFLGDLHTNCIRSAFGDQVDVGLELVFGERPSPGFICGMAKHVIGQEEPMPGFCCLDAPWQLPGDSWGHPYDCSSNTCSKVGPFFSGMSTEACDAQGGTWCPYETDCSRLQECIADDIASSAEEFPAYSNYLQSAPKINDPSDQAQCGRTREYFHYDEYFLNDKAICDEIYELRFSKDFNFLNEFFGGKPAGGGRPAASGDGSYVKLPTIDGLDFDPITPPFTPEFDLGDIDYAHSSTELAEKGLLWRHANTALGASYGFLQTYLEDVRQDNTCELALVDGGCITPAGPSPTSFAKLVCELKRKVFATLLSYGRMAVAILHFCSVQTYTFAMEQGNNEPWHIMDELDAVKTNMDHTGTYLQKRFEQQNDFIADHHQKVGEALKEHQQETGQHITDTNALVITVVNDARDQVTSTVEEVANTALALNVEIVTNLETLKQVILLTTFQGALSDYSSITIQGVVGGTDEQNPSGGLSDLTPTNLQSLGTGKALLTLPSSSTTVVTFDIALDVGAKQYKQSALVSFAGSCS